MTANSARDRSGVPDSAARMNYDFVVVGGGSAGYAGARTAFDLGMKTCVVEGGATVGGLCILRGCMPSKTVIESANRLRAIRHAREFGLRAGQIGFDAGEIVARKQRLVSEFADHRREQLQEGGFDFVRGTATFLDENTLQVKELTGSEKLLSARSFLISTGSIISVPEIPGLDEAGCLTSDDALTLTQIPDSILVLGGGPVALEFAHYLEALGSRVTIIQRSAQLLKGIDADLAKVVEDAFRKRGMQIFTKTKIVRLERTGDARRVIFEHEGSAKTVEATAILNALGREPNIHRLGLEKAGARVQDGAIAVNSHQQTSMPHIFAAGDCSGPFEIVHLAVEQGERAARNAVRLLKGDSNFESMDYRLKLFVVFTEPQVATVGLSQTEAEAKGLPYLVATYPFCDHGKSMVIGETDGFVKLVADKSTREILGGSVAGPDAATLIHEVVVAMRFRATAGQLATIPHYHPTLSEIWLYPAEQLAGISPESAVVLPGGHKVVSSPPAS
jgi:pyruvate/2-oxoglutarate dehydrogenase complex dihydrolipoamide dehydrogenase (E3) component